MKLKIVLLVLSFGMFLGCKSTQDSFDEYVDNAVLDQMIENKKFSLRADWAQPLGTTSVISLANSGLLPPGSAINRINLMGTNNYLRMEDGKVSADIPYYGERQIGGTYARAEGVVFNDEPRDLKIERNEKKKSYIVTFNVRNRTETYRVNAELFPNMTTQIVVNSSQRFVIRYSGVILTPEEDKADRASGK